MTTESPSAAFPLHASEKAVLASTHDEKQKPGLVFDLNYPPPPPLIVETELIKGETPKDAVIAIHLDGAEDVDVHAHDNEGSIKEMRGLEEASGSVSKRRRYTVEEKGKRKVYEVGGGGDDDDDGDGDVSTQAQEESPTQKTGLLGGRTS